MGLRGPADAGRFRVTKYGDTHWAYRDPLPACPIAPATTDEWPGFSRVKKAWSKEFSKKLPTGMTVPLDAYRCATFTADNLPTLTNLDREAAVELVAGAARRDLRRAGNRGNAIHEALEDIACGRAPKADLTPDAAPYMDVCKQLIDDVQPDFLYSEYVSIDRALGIAGTGDAVWFADLWEFGKVTVAVDYKTRGADAQHAAYEEEACQVALHAAPGYYIVADEDGNAVRCQPPQVDLGLIVSLRPDSYELFPIDLGAGRRALECLVASFKHKTEGQQSARKAIGKPIHTSRRGQRRLDVAVAEAGNPDVRAWLLKRTERLRDHPGALERLANNWPDGVPTFKNSVTHTPEQLRKIEAALRDVEFTFHVPAVNMGPDSADPADVELMVDKLKTLPDHIQAAIGSMLDLASLPRNIKTCNAAQLEAYAEIVAEAEAAAAKGAA